MKLLTLLAGLFLSFGTSAEECNGHLEFTIKNKQSTIDQVLCSDGYAVGYSYYYKAPMWVQYRLTKESVAPNNGRGGNPFKEDDRIPEEFRASLWDYKYSGFDRGHMAPRAAMDETPTLRDKSFLLSNMTPQEAKLNQRGWADLEEYVRDIATKHEEIYVVTGALFEGVNRTIGRGIYIPSHLYKVIYIPSKEQMLAFMIPNEAFDIDDLDKMQVKPALLERHSGLDFFQNIVNSKEKLMEKTKINYCDLLGDGHLPQEAC
ncbi:MAG: DNA/RNA endonuclease G [Gammaproteobacteria bacterium]|nr:MAG: DNA/RNA endonuclease G [Gammaproteobacteria bacterium]